MRKFSRREFIKGTFALSASASLIPAAINFAYIKKAMAGNPHTVGTSTGTQSTDSSYMAMGANANWIATWDNPRYFIDQAHQIGMWEPVVGGGTVTQNLGAILSTSSKDAVFRAYIRDGGVLKTGIYHIFWSGDGQVGVGGFSKPTSWDTSGTFTYNFNAEYFLGVFFKGNNLVSLSIVHDDYLSDWKKGAYWNPDFIAYATSLNMASIRFMDPNDASRNLEMTWSDRVPLNAIAYQSRMPWEAQIDLANKLNIDPWLNVPCRADSDYAQQLGKLIKTKLNRGLVAYIELGNETWNWSNPWRENYAWCRLLDHTKLIASCDPDVSDTNFTLKNHGFQNGTTLEALRTTQQYKDGITPNWTLMYGTETTVNVIDANTFSVSYNGEVQKITGIAPGGQKQHTQCFVRKDETAVLSQPEGFARLLQQLWTNLAVTCTTNQYKRILSTQCTVPSVTKGILDNISDTSQVDYVAVAPYSGLQPWVAKLSIVNGGVTPSFSALNSNTVYYLLYRDTDTVTEYDLQNGHGALSSGSINTSGGAKWIDGALMPISTNGSYVVYFYVTVGKQLPLSCVVRSNFTFPATNTTLYATPSLQQLKYLEYTTLHDVTILLNGQLAVMANAPNAKLVGYEGAAGSDNTGTTEVLNLFNQFTQSSEYTSFYDMYMRTLAKLGFALFEHYKMLGNNLDALAINEYSQDNRRTTFANLNGQVAKPTRLVVPTSPPIVFLASAPSTLPYKVADLPASDALGGVLTHTIVDGDLTNAFTIQNNQLLLADISSIDWSRTTIFNVVVLSESPEDFALTTAVANCGGGGNYVIFSENTNSKTLLASSTSTGTTTAINTSVIVACTGNCIPQNTFTVDFYKNNQSYAIMYIKLNSKILANTKAVEVNFWAKSLTGCVDGPSIQANYNPVNNFSYPKALLTKFIKGPNTISDTTTNLTNYIIDVTNDSGMDLDPSTYNAMLRFIFHSGSDNSGIEISNMTISYL